VKGTSVRRSPPSRRCRGTPASRLDVPESDLDPRERGLDEHLAVATVFGRRPFDETELEEYVGAVSADELLSELATKGDGVLGRGGLP
jgi:hypothetical protein